MTTHKSTIIQPFPDHIDRNHFGSWLSGFVDGEASFMLNFGKGKSRHKFTFGTARIAIVLRDDDAAIQYLIQSYWNTGIIYHQTRKQSTVDNKPQVMYVVLRIADLHNIVVPHFEKYPLMAKKKRDFEIWSEAVRLIYKMAMKPRVGRGISRGMKAKWDSESTSKFVGLLNKLNQTRKYDKTLGEPLKHEKFLNVNTSQHTQGCLFDFT